MAIEFKPCGECVACCSGLLAGTAYGNIFNINKPCAFLVDHKCTIYETRPPTCRTYQCAWSQGILPDDMKPSECGFIVSVEIENNKQFLHVIIPHNKDIDTKFVDYLDQWTKDNNTYYRITKHED